MGNKILSSSVLRPEQIIVPGEYELGNEAILKIYFRIFDRGHGIDLPPPVVVSSNLISPESRQERLGKQVRKMEDAEKHERLIYDPYGFSSYTKSATPVKEARRRYGILEGKIKSAPYYLIEGNHRTAAATLTHNPIHAIELKTDDDLEEVRLMVRRGEVFSFNRTETSLRELVFGFEEHLLGKIENCRTVRERVDALVSSDGLPQYMRERYLQGG